MKKRNRKMGLFQFLRQVYDGTSGIISLNIHDGTTFVNGVQITDRQYEVFEGDIVEWRYETQPEKFVVHVPERFWKKNT